MRTLIAVLLTATFACAQQPEQPKVHVNYLNVCAPTESDRNEIAAALKEFATPPAITSDYEVTRGHSTQPEQGAIRYFRLRREFRTPSALDSATYSISDDAKGLTEMLILKPHDSKQILGVTLRQDHGTESPAQLLTTAPHVESIDLERFGKQTAAIARCANGDQSALEPLFAAASEMMQHYRTELHVAQFRSDLEWIAPVPSKIAKSPRKP